MAKSSFAGVCDSTGFVRVVRLRVFSAAHIRFILLVVTHAFDPFLPRQSCSSADEAIKKLCIFIFNSADTIVPSDLSHAA